MPKPRFLNRFRTANSSLSCFSDFLTHKNREKERKNKLSSSRQDPNRPIALLNVIRLCVTNNVFIFLTANSIGKFTASRWHGLSLILATLFMAIFESELLSAILSSDTIWFRYVDDTFSMWQMNRSNFGDYFNRLNRLARTINSKVEWEDSGKLPFLDVLLSNVTDTLKFSSYRKPTHTASDNFFFNHPLYIKRSIVLLMFLRDYRICDN